MLSTLAFAWERACMVIYGGWVFGNALNHPKKFLTLTYWVHTAPPTAMPLTPPGHDARDNPRRLTVEPLTAYPRDLALQTMCLYVMYFTIDKASPHATVLTPLLHGVAFTGSISVMVGYAVMAFFGAAHHGSWYAWEAAMSKVGERACVRRASVRPAAYMFRVRYKSPRTLPHAALVSPSHHLVSPHP